MEVNGYTEWKHGGYSDVEPADNGHRKLENSLCSVYGAGQYYVGRVGKCLDLEGLEVDNQITYIRSTKSTCIEVFENGEGSGRSLTYCGPWAELDETVSDKVSRRVCCVALESSSALATKAPTKAGWN